MKMLEGMPPPEYWREFPSRTRHAHLEDMGRSQLEELWTVRLDKRRATLVFLPTLLPRPNFYEFFFLCSYPYL